MSELELLELVLRVTQSGKLLWRQVSADRYEAEIDKYLYFIEQEAPALAGGSTAFTTMYRVGVAEALITFADGTPHVALVEQILASAFQEWSDHVRFTDRFRSEAGARLHRLLGE